MRVAHVIFGEYVPQKAGGVTKTVYYLAIKQSSLMVQSAIFAFSRGHPQIVANVDIFHLNPPKEGVLFRVFPWTHPRNIKLLLEWRPSIVHFHSVHIGPFLALAKQLKRHGVPYVITPNGGIAPGRLKVVSYPVRTYMRLLELPFWNSAAFVHAVSGNDALGAKMLGIRAPVVVVPNGLDLSEVPQHLDKEALFRRFPQLRERRVFVFLGRLDPKHKGLDILLEAWARSRPGNAALLLLGPDWKGSEAWLKRRIEELALEEDVLLGGPVFGEEKWSYLAAAHVFVHPSRWEGVPFSVLEAMAVGKPVLVTPPADPGGVIAAFGAGVVVEPEPEAIARGLGHLGSLSEEELKQMGEWGRKLVEEHFSWERIASELLSAYEKVLLGKGAS